MIEITEEVVKEVITKRPAESYKGMFGKTVLIGGNPQYGGAIIMSAESCIRSGAGLTTVVTAKKNHAPLHTRLPEAMVVDFSETELIQEVVAAADVVLIGPGLGLEEASCQLLKDILALQNDQWYVIDGSAITLFAQQDLQLNHPEKVVFTPHQMEWQRLSGIAISNQTTANNQQAQKKLGAKIVLKSHRTELLTDTAHYRNTTGNAGMATGGQGDTLAGLISGFLAQFDKNDRTIAAAIYLHSRIGDELAQNHYVVLPTTISHELPRWMQHFSRKED